MSDPSASPSRPRSASRVSRRVRVLQTQTTRWLARPPRPPDRLTPWLVLLGILLVGVLALTLQRAEPDVLYVHELRTLSTSLETWQYREQANENVARFATLALQEDAQPRLDRPPVGHWLHLLSFTGLDLNDYEPAQVLARARMVSALFMLLCLAAVFWAGFSIGGLYTATMAALICLANPVLLFYARLATLELPTVALASLAVAAALWALRPLKPAPRLSRQAVGWALAGLALGLAVLSGGFLLLLAVLIPLIVILVLLPHRLGHALGLVAATFVAALITMPWVLYVHEQEPGMWHQWLNQLTPGHLATATGFFAEATERAGWLLLATLPWTLWLLAGVLQPFSSASSGSRLRAFLGWVWFVPVCLILLIAHEPDSLPAMLLVIPPAALLCGQVMRRYIDLSAEARHAFYWTWFRWPHAGLLLLTSLALPVVGHFQHQLVAEGWLGGVLTATMHPAYWSVAAIALAAIALLSMRYVHLQHPGRTVICWAGWTVLALLLLIVPLMHGPAIESTGLDRLPEIGR